MSPGMYWIHPDSPPTRAWKRLTGSEPFLRAAKVTETSQNTFKPVQPGVERHGKQLFSIKPHDTRWWSHCGSSSPRSSSLLFSQRVKEIESAGVLTSYCCEIDCLCYGFSALLFLSNEQCFLCRSCVRLDARAVQSTEFHSVVTFLLCFPVSSFACVMQTEVCKKLLYPSA